MTLQLRIILLLLCQWLLPFSVCGSKLRRSTVSGDAPDEQGKVLLNSAAIMQGIQELAISKSASESAHMSAKSIAATQDEFAARQALERTRQSYDKVKGKWSEMRAQQLKVRIYASRARQYANHAAKVAFATRKLVQQAADKALEATKSWIMHDAEKDAEAKAATQQANFAASKADKIAGAVAAAAEPCHLELLRTQKFCTETYAKAKSTQVSVQQLMVKARKIASNAQDMQRSGMIPDAQTTMGVASGMMQEAEKIRQYGLILYTQANNACNNAGYYELCEQQAAASAAATQVINTPMKLPNI